MRKVVWCSALTAVTTLVGVACSSSRAPDEASLTLTGRVRLTSAAGKASTVFRDQTIRRGQTVRVTKGTATLEFSSGRRLELREGSAVKVDRVPSVLSGDVLLQTGLTKFAVRAAGSTVTLTDGAARLSRRLGLETATYRGKVALASIGHTLDVPALRQAAVPSLGVVPAKPEPLRLQPTDGWDRRFLGEAIELSEQLQTRSDGLTGQLPRGDVSVGFLTTLLPALDSEREFDPALLHGQRAPGETVVGASIAAAGRVGAFADRWHSVFSFRDEGAAWGLVALDQNLSDAPGLSSTIDSALGRAQSFTVQVAAAPTATTPAVSPDAPSSTPVTSGASQSPPTTGSPGGGGGGGDGGSQAPPPTPAPTPGLIEPVIDTVGDLLGGLVTAIEGG